MVVPACWTARSSTEKVMLVRVTMLVAVVPIRLAVLDGSVKT
jgi:hypothetical protein